MLGTRTKQVSSYGRRNRRIINDRHDLFDVEDINGTHLSGKAREPTSNGHPILVPNTPPPVLGRRAGKKLEISAIAPPSISPPRPSHNRQRKRRENNQARSSFKRFHSPSSTRTPLSSHSGNISRHPSLSGHKKARPSMSKGVGTPLVSSPVVNVDIFVLDENGRRVSQERRISNTNVQVNQRTDLHSLSPTYQHSTAANVTVVSDNDGDDGDYAPSLLRRAKRWPRVMFSSDEEDVAEPSICPASFSLSPRADHNRIDPAKTLISTDFLADSTSTHSSPQKRTTLIKSQFWVEIISSRTPGLSQSRPQELTYSPLQLPPNKPRQLTPIRRGGLAFPRLPSSPSTSTDLDISIDLADLTLSSPPFEDHTLPDQPLHLIPLLDECGQNAPVEFSAFIEAFPVHPIIRSSCSGNAVFQKIGEASYSEVFGIGDVVLKVVPIRNEECPDIIEAETPAPSDAKDVLNEIVVTRALGEMCDGFISLLKTYVVRGKYPSLLLDLWDEYNRSKGSESVRPGVTLPRLDATPSV
jgi:serine/threonine-protein kinase haspin